MEGFIYLVLLCLFVWLNVHLAVKRNRNPWGWGAASVVFGLFATILLVLLGTKEEKLDV